MTKHDISERVFRALEDEDLINFHAADNTNEVHDRVLEVIERQLQELIIVNGTIVE